jgi:N-6 DNA Methylase
MPLDGIAKLKIPFSSDEIFSPNGVGAKVSAKLASEKIGNVIKREKGVQPKVGILVGNPKAKETQQLIAIICKFDQSVTQDVVDLAHKLCWNFCRSPLLIVIEPLMVRVFSCYQKPERQLNDVNQLPFGEAETEFSAPKPIYKYNPEKPSSEAKSAIKALQWIELVSGNFFNKEKKYFPREQRADKTLLDNLSSIRKQLKEEGLEYDTIHDLLARIIFIQFLFDRKDSNGTSVISSEYLKGLYVNKKLSAQHQNPEEILRNYNDAYRFFKLLNVRFNGDLFPGDKEEDWQDEMSKVKPKHLELLADFIGGKFILENGLTSFWKMYSFDTIPLEFISSIYEEFVSQQQHQEKNKDSKAKGSNRENGVYYTKSHLVDFMLDNVLPWDEKVWNLKILDPSCGSGIFLVKAFQRLVHRWENSLSITEKKSAEFSKKKKEKVIYLLKNNLFGVDIDKHAVRVASFSLYLALCDELDPKTLWQEVTFPNLREKQVVARDFFDEDEPLFRHHKEEIRYDLIIGNAPWGRNTIKGSQRAKTWAKNNGWETSYGNIGPLFLPKAVSLAKENAYISLVQPALPILTGQSGKAERFRKRLFKEYKVAEVVNLSDLRFVLFEKAISPPCIITIRPFKPDKTPIQYICPKKRATDEDFLQIIIEPMDVNFVQVNEAIEEPWVWVTLMWGNRRDVSLIYNLKNKNNIAKAVSQKKALTRQGIIRGDCKKEEEIIFDKPILKDSNFPLGTFLVLNDETLEPNKNILVDSKASSDFSSFVSSQMFIKQTWKTDSYRFNSIFVESTSESGTLCSSSYLNVHSEDINFLKSATITYKSRLAVYFLLLTDGRFAFYRPEPSVESFWKVPIPSILEKYFGKLESLGKANESKALRKLDNIVLKSLGLNESEKILIEDLFDYTLRDFKGNENSIGRNSTQRKQETDLTDYCKTFFKVINAGFGNDKNLRATIFQETENELPVRMVAIHLDYLLRDELIKTDKCSNEQLWKRLNTLNEKFMQNESENGNIYYQRVVRIYANDDGIPTVYLIKPDQKRYWLKSQALRDADEVSADIVSWFQQQKSKGAKK